MFYAMTRLHFEEARFDDLLSLAIESKDQVEAIGGLQFAELIKTGEGEGMVIAAYDNESSAESMKETLADWDDLLTSQPHGHEGTVVFRFGDSPGE